MAYIISRNLPLGLRNMSLIQRTQKRFSTHINHNDDKSDYRTVDYDTCQNNLDESALHTLSLSNTNNESFLASDIGKFPLNSQISPD